jgi:hypothetical protein
MPPRVSADAPTAGLSYPTHDLGGVAIAAMHESGGVEPVQAAPMVSEPHQIRKEWPSFSSEG